MVLLNWLMSSKSPSSSIRVLDPVSVCTVSAHTPSHNLLYRCARLYFKQSASSVIKAAHMERFWWQQLCLFKYSVRVAYRNIYIPEMIVSVLCCSNILCLRDFFSIPHKLIIKIRTLSLSPSVNVRHLEWRHVGVQRRSSRALPITNDSTLGLEEILHNAFII